MRGLEAVPDDVIPIRGQGHHCRYKQPGFWFDPGKMNAICGGGTAGRTIVILGEWARRHLRQPMEVMCVGFDAVDQPAGWTDETMYAKCIPQIVGQRGKNYTGIVQKMGEAIFAYRHNLVIRWFHQELAIQHEAATMEP
jgi:hypothetical protein